MAGTLKIGGNTIATHAGSEGAGTVTLDSSTLTIGSNTSFSGATLNGATFPAGHVVQTVHLRATSLTSDTTVNASTIDATHLEKNITITAGNSVHFTFSFTLRAYANATDYFNASLFVYNKITSGGTYASISTSNSGNGFLVHMYDDVNGSLPSQWYEDRHFNISGIHTPSSGTEQYYKLYYKFSKGTEINFGIGADSSDQFVILQEIQA
jgi:hypothetical protein